MSERRFLHSWKDISNYTGRGVRTLQRYEMQLGFPIHRPAGTSRSAVLAFSDEIDEWFSKAPKRTASVGAPPTQVTTKYSRRHVAIAASATRTQEMAKATFEACALQAKRVEEMIKKMKRHEIKGTPRQAV